MYEGQERRSGEHCNAHEQNTVDIIAIKTSQAAQQASTRTWRVAGSIAGGALMMIVGFTGWVATDTLSGLRTDIKDLKSSVNTSASTDSRYSSDLQYLTQRIGAMEQQMLRLEGKIDGKRR